jgi:hypothetical protein
VSLSDDGTTSSPGVAPNMASLLRSMQVTVGRSLQLQGLVCTAASRLALQIRSGLGGVSEFAEVCERELLIRSRR